MTVVKDIEQLKADRMHSETSIRKIKSRADSEGRELNGQELTQVESYLDELEGYDQKIKIEERAAGLLSGNGVSGRVTEEPFVEGETVPMDRGGAGGAREEDREDAEDYTEDPYSVRWDRRGGAEQFRDMSIQKPREFLRSAGTRDYNLAFYTYLRNKRFANTDIQALQNVRAQVEGVDADGGYLAPTQLVAGILREAQVLEELRPRMDVIRSNARSLTYTKGLDSIVMGWVAELGTKPEDQVTFGRTVLVPHVGAVVIWVSDELLEDEVFGLQGYLQARVAEAKVLLEEEAFVSGSGSGRPFGILTRLNAQGGTPNRFTTQTAAGGVIPNVSDDIVKIPYTMPVQYRRNGTYILGTNFIRSIRLQRDAGGASAATGGYMWQPSLQAGEPDMLNGYPVVETTSVALNSAIATGNDVGIFGDLRRYRVFERLGLQVKRLEELRALTDEVGFRFRFRTGGDVMLEEAFRTIRVG